MNDLTSPSVALQGATVKGNVHGGQQPVVGAHVYLFAAGANANAGPGINPAGQNASVSLLVPTATGLSDALGAYVLTDANGNFSVSGDYTCTSGTQLYLYALGGNPGAGVNSGAGFMAGLGNCPSNGSLASTVPFVFMNEVSTVSMAYSLAGFASDGTHISSGGSALAATDVANAFLTNANLAGIATGQALTVTPAGNGSVPTATINTIANILASCVNSASSTSVQCNTLFTNARQGGATGLIPTDTAGAAINIAHNPAVNVGNLFALSTPNPQFAPALTTQPADYLIGIKYSGTSSTGGGLNGAYAIAIDNRGGIWFTNVNGNSITKLTNTGAPLTPANGSSSGNNFLPLGIAIDTSENAWVIDSQNNALTKFGPNAAPLATYGGGGIALPQGVAIDGNNNIFISNIANSSVSVFNQAGTPLSPANGFSNGGLQRPTTIAVSPFGNAWTPGKNAAPGVLNTVTTTGSVGNTAPGAGGLSNPIGVAVDGAGNVFVSNLDSNTISKFNSNGAPVSATGFSGGGLNQPYFLAIDGAGNVWVANSGNSTVTELTNAGNPVSPSTGYGPTLFQTPNGIEIDGSGDVWVTNYNNAGGSQAPTQAAVTELVGAAVPRVTPLSVGIKNGTLGARP